MTLLEGTVWEAFRAYGCDPEVEVREGEDVRSVLTSAGHEGLNAIVQAADVTRALEPFRRRRVPVLWHVGPDEGAVERRLLDAGLGFYEEEPGMVARLGASADVPMPDGLRIELVRDRQQLRRFVELWTGSTSDAFLSLVTRLRAATGLGEDATFQHLLGLLDGRAVATAAVAHGTRASEIQHVVTLPDVRRRGIGASMTAAAMELARRRGHEHAVLTSSPEGEGVYRALGFEAVCAVRRFLWRPAR